MLDALLYAVRDSIRDAGFGYSEASCEIMADGSPPARCGNVFVAVHEGATKTTGETDNKLDEYYGFSVTLTQRIKAPPDKIGTAEIALRNFVAKEGRETGFNRRCEQLRAFLHMAWGVMQIANNNLIAWADENTNQVYGFGEPCRFEGMDAAPRLVGAAWFSADPESDNFGLACELRFGRARRFQPIGTYT